MAKIESRNFPDKTALMEHEETGTLVPPAGIRVLKSGAGISVDTGDFIYGAGTFMPNPHAFNSKTGHEARMRRIAKKEERIRSKIVERIKGGDADAEDFLDEFADAAGVLWEEIVRNRSSEDHPGRTRMDVWKEIGKQAGIVPDGERSSEGREGASLTIKGMTPELARAIRSIIQTSGSE